MKVQSMQRAYYADQIRKRIESEPIQMSEDPITQARISEVVNALALGCSLQRPRLFRKHMMTADDFRRIASDITLEEIAVAVNARIKIGEKVENPTWYILGVLARF